MVEFTHEEVIALKSILDICLEQFEVSGGDIDYAGFGERSAEIIRSISEKI